MKTQLLRSVSVTSEQEEHRPDKQTYFCDPGQVTLPWVSFPTYE